MPEILELDVLYANTCLLAEPRSRCIALDLLKIDMRNFGIVAIEDFGYFFERRTACLDVREAYKDELDENPHLEHRQYIQNLPHRNSNRVTTYSIDSVQLPRRFQMIESQRINILINRQRNLYKEIHNHQPLSPNLERQYLHRVRHKQARPCERIRDLEDPDHGNDGFARSFGMVFLLLRGADCPDDECDAHGRSRCDE